MIYRNLFNQIQDCTLSTRSTTCKPFIFAGMQTNCHILKSESTKHLPVIAHVPHSSVIVPANVRPEIVLNDAELNEELLALTDRYTDELFDGIVKLGGYAFVNKLSRLVIDPERFPLDEEEEMSKKGMGAVYRLTSQGRILREESIFNKCRGFLMSRYFFPYSSAFEDLTSKVLIEFGHCLIIDCHSYPLIPLPYEKDPEATRPDICIGTSKFHTPAIIMDIIKDYCKVNDLSLGINAPFKDTYVPLKFYRKDQRVSSVMFEIRRDLYMDESSCLKNEGFDRIKAHIEVLTKILIDAFMKF